MLKMVSRRRSEVGRTASEPGPLSERPRQRPPTILMAYLTLAAAARAAFGAALWATFEAAFRGSPWPALEPAACPASRAAPRGAVAPRGGAARTLVIAPGAERPVPCGPAGTAILASLGAAAEGAIPWWFPGTVAALAGPEGTVTLRPARSILAFAAGAEGTFVSRPGGAALAALAGPEGTI